MKQKLGALMVIVSLAMGCSGCVALLVGAAAGAGGVAYVQGGLEKNVDHSVAQAYKASLAALKSLDMFVTSKEQDPHSAKIKAEASDGKSVTIDIESLTERSSKIKIRVGIMGDQERSQIILNAIQRRL